MARVPTEPRSIGIFLLRQIGDVLMVTPALAALRRRFPNAKITVLVNDFTAPMLENNPDVDELKTYPRANREKSRIRRLAAELRLAQWVRACKFDSVFDLTSGDRPAIYSWLSGAKSRIAFQPSPNAWWKRMAYTNVISLPAERIHQTERHLRLLADFAVPLSPVPPLKLRLTTEEQAWAASEKVRIGGKYAVVHFTANWLFKCWENDRAAQIIDWLSSSLGLKVCFTCGPSERELNRAREIVELCRIPPVTRFGDLSLRQMAALFSGSEVFVGVDTAPMHIAAAMGVPVVALFGPTLPQLWAPRSPRSVVLRGRCICEETGAQKCDWSVTRACLREVSVKEVQDAVCSFLIIPR